MMLKKGFRPIIVLTLVFFSLPGQAARETVYYPDDFDKSTESETDFVRFYPGKGVQVLSINGSTDNYKSSLFKRPARNDDDAVLLRPGKYTISYNYKGGKNVPQSRELDAATGKNYYLHREAPKDPADSSNMPLYISWIDEYKEDGPDYERVKAGKYCIVMKYSETQLGECEKAANMGDGASSYRLGLQFYKGAGTGQDYEKAFRWFSGAADTGYSDAYINLGYMYEKGQGVEADQSKAVEWYTRSADSGETLAMFSLARIYTYGKNEMRDREKGMQWLRKAAMLGDSSSMYMLGLMNYSKKTAMENLVKSHAYLEMADESGWSDKAPEAREKIAAIMSEEQLKESADLAAAMSRDVHPARTLDLCINGQDLTEHGSGDKPENPDASGWEIQINRGGRFKMDDDTPVFRQLPAQNTHHFTAYYRNRKLDSFDIPYDRKDGGTVCLYLNRTRNAWRIKESLTGTMENCGCTAPTAVAGAGSE